MTTKLLEVRSLSRTFGGLKAVSDLSFHVQQDEIVGLIGPNGAGKTTVVNMLSGAIAPSEGEIAFAGASITRLSTARRARMGLVRTFQQTAVFGDQTVWENAIRGSYLTRYPGVLRSLLGRAQQANASETDALLARFGLAHVKDALAGSLPYGLQKILGIALAMAARPRLLLLDEPVAGLSAEETDKVRDVIHAARKDGVSILVIEHNMRFMTQLCDRLVVVAHGQELTTGTPAEALRDERVVEAYLGRPYAAT